MREFICGLVHGHQPEHGDFVNGRWVWSCLRCGRVEPATERKVGA